MESTTPPAAPGPEDTTPLERAEARADHFERILAALVHRFGPLRLYPGEYGTADPSQLVLLGLAPGDAGRRPPTFALRDQIGADGQLVTRLASTAAVIEAYRADDDGAISAARELLRSFNLVTDEDPPVTEPLPPVEEGHDG